MDIRATQLKEHVFYELDMLRYTHGALVQIERSLAKDPDALSRVDRRIINALVEAFCIHARNLDEFFQGTGLTDTLSSDTFADDQYRPRLSDEERKRLKTIINRHITPLTEHRTSEPRENIGSEDRTRLYGLLVDEADHFTRHLLRELQPAWDYVPSAQPPAQTKGPVSSSTCRGP